MQAPLTRERFIPVAKAELVERLADSDLVAPSERALFGRFSRLLDSLFHFEFHSRTEALKESYRPFNPDSDLLSTRPVTAEERVSEEARLMSVFKAVLNQANYQQITEADLAYAINRESLFNINLFVDFRDFEHQLVFSRGSHIQQVRRKKWLFREETSEITVFDRVALIIKFKDEAYFRERDRGDLNFNPGSMLVKLFKNIPKGDLEMLFPNAQVRMKLKDKLLMGGIALGGGISVMLKTSAGLVAMVGILWLMARAFLSGGGQVPALGPVEVSGIVGWMTALAAIGIFLFKQWNSYKNRFMKQLGDSLYFKNLDNNAGVFYHIIADAEEEEFKEALLGYLFLRSAPSGMTAAALDQAIETWFARMYDATIDFEIEDALAKLKRLDLCRIDGHDASAAPLWQALPLADAFRQLDRRWDDFF
jgi:hypothetical protein